jgi:hypothetical protein
MTCSPDFCKLLFMYGLSIVVRLPDLVRQLHDNPEYNYAIRQGKDIKNAQLMVITT